MLTIIVSIISLLLSMIATSLAETMRGSVSILGDFVRLSLSKNPGIAFGIRLPSVWQEWIIGLAMVAVCFAAMKAKRTDERIAFGLIVGGAAANLFDRIQDGLVTDYVAVGSFPVFNVADACITAGAAMLILSIFWAKKRL